jgi:hypothetical protein
LTRSESLELPFKLRVKPASPGDLQEPRQQLDEFLNKGLIPASKRSPYAAPVRFIRKEDESTRIGFDYRALNSARERNRYPLPPSKTLGATLCGAQVFSKVDVPQGYHQIGIQEHNIRYLDHIVGHSGVRGDHYKGVRLEWGEAEQVALAEMD